MIQASLTAPAIHSVLHTESSLGWGGQENRTLNEMSALSTLGWRCLLACRPGARLGERAAEQGFAVHEIDMRGFADLASMAALRRLIHTEAVDVVNSHSGRDSQLAGLAVRSLFAQRPAMVRTRHLALPVRSRFGYSVLPDHVVTVSDHVRRYLVSVGVSDQAITPVLTGVDLQVYQTPSQQAWRSDGGTLRSELGLPPDTPLIGTVAILRVKKGHADLLEAVPQVLSRYPNAHFVFAGDGPQQKNLRAKISDMQLSERVLMLGLRSDVGNILHSLDIFVLPTHQEALGTAFVEAGAMCLPSIGTHVDGVPEVILDGQTGLLVPPHESGALAEAIIKLLADPALRHRLGKAARQRVQTHFSLQAMGHNMISVYEKLLSRLGK